MEYTEIKGDLFEHATTDYILHGCNAQGVMGSGFARIIREKWPEVFKQYLNWCSINNPKNILGSYQVVAANRNLFVINAITQLRYGTDKRHVDYDAVAQVFETMASSYHGDQGINIHMPMIGAGLGGGNWNIIRTIIMETLKDTDVSVRVYYL